VISLLVGWKWNPGVGFGIIATIAVPLVVLVYMLVCVGCIAYYLRERRSEFNPLLHLLLPIGGIVLFFFPLYYQFVKVPPPYPFKWANWVSASYTILGILVTIAVVTLRPDRLADVDRVYVEDDTVEGNVAISPVA
jgi:amino acid transporter